MDTGCHEVTLGSWRPQGGGETAQTGRHLRAKEGSQGTPHMTRPRHPAFRCGNSEFLWQK